MFVGQYVFLCVIALFIAKCAGNENGRHTRILLDDNYYSIVSRLDNLEHEVQALKTENADLTQRLQSTQNVAFQASLSHSISGSQNQVILFDTVELNIGNAYNVHHGNMIAPVNGTYLFSMTACSGSNHAIVFDLVKNGATIGRLLAGDDQYTACSSKTFVTQLKKGDDVYVTEGTYGDQIYSVPAYGRPHFMGILLYSN